MVPIVGCRLLSKKPLRALTLDSNDRSARRDLEYRSAGLKLIFEPDQDGLGTQEVAREPNVYAPVWFEVRRAAIRSADLLS